MKEEGDSRQREQQEASESGGLRSREEDEWLDWGMREQREGMR